MKTEQGGLPLVSADYGWLYAVLCGFIVTVLVHPALAQTEDWEITTESEKALQ